MHVTAYGGPGVVIFGTQFLNITGGLSSFKPLCNIDFPPYLGNQWVLTINDMRGWQALHKLSALVFEMC